MLYSSPRLGEVAESQRGMFLYVFTTLNYIIPFFLFVYQM